MSKVSKFEAKAKFGEPCDAEVERSLANIRRAAEGLEVLQKEIAKSPQGKKSFSWQEFKSAVEDGRK